jgi:beta-N-acetylhexosaminidase
MHTSSRESEQQPGQLLLAGFEGRSPPREILDLLEKQQLGGVILFARNSESAEQVFALTSELQARARAAGHRYPLLVAIDHENGMVQRLGDWVTLFPGNMALAATDSAALVQAISAAAGRELLALGINLNLAPVLDINTNAANPVIGVRAFGDDPEQVARLGVAAVRGYLQASIVCCVKHFPGHGDTATDSHLALPQLPHGWERLISCELLPFARALAAGAPCVMVGHLALPALTGDSALPASVAPAIIQGLLREQLGFEGVAISDCLEMAAISNTLGVERAAVMALQAGLDLLIISHHYERQLAALEALHRALREGRLAQQRLAQALGRVLRLKARYLSWERLPGADGLRQLQHPHHLQLQRQSYAQSITLLRNADGLLPLHLQAEQRLLIVLLRTASLSRLPPGQAPGETLLTAVRRYHANSRALEIDLSSNEVRPPLAARLAPALAEADLVLLATGGAYLDRSQSALIAWLRGQLSCPVIGLALVEPYDLLAYPWLSTCLVTYECTPPALEMAVDVIFGARPPQGRLPVSLPGLHARGEGQRFGRWEQQRTAGEIESGEAGQAPS